MVRKGGLPPLVECLSMQRGQATLPDHETFQHELLNRNFIYIISVLDWLMVDRAPAFGPSQPLLRAQFFQSFPKKVEICRLVRG